MSDTEIPALPVLVPLTVMAVAVVIWWLRRHHQMTAPKVTVGLVTCVYGAAVVYNTLLPFPITSGAGQAWRVWLHLTPLVDVMDDPIGIVLNVALFVPLGFLLPLVARVGSARRALVIGLAISLGIEIVQLAADLTVSTGRIADVDDLIGNGVGTVIGYAAFRLAVLVPAVGRVATKATWGPDR